MYTRGDAGLAERKPRWSVSFEGFRKTNIYLAIDVLPLLGRAQHVSELVEQCFVVGRELEPREEVEFFTKVTAMVQSSRDRGKESNRRFDVPGAFLENRATLILREGPPRVVLPNRNEGRSRRLWAT